MNNGTDTSVRPERVASAAQRLRIGEFSRRVGVPVELLRAWERRYKLFQPGRTAGGFRLYSDADVARALAMQTNLDRGLSAAEAARRVLEDEAESRSGGTVERAVDDLADRLERFDEVGAQAILDQLFTSLSLETVLKDVLLPYLRQLGRRWEDGQASIAQEHFASNVIRGRLMSLARGWDRGSGPRALLACAPGDQHDLPLLMLGLALRSHGWRISYLGADTPSDSLVAVVREISPDIVVVASSVGGILSDHASGLKSVADAAPLHLAGRGLDPEIAAGIGAAYLSGDPVEAAAEVAAAHG